MIEREQKVFKLVDEIFDLVREYDQKSVELDNLDHEQGFELDRLMQRTKEIDERIYEIVDKGE